MKTNVDIEFSKELYKFLSKVNTPMEWLTSEKIDLEELFIKLKENGNINIETFKKLNDILTCEKPTL